MRQAGGRELDSVVGNTHRFAQWYGRRRKKGRTFQGVGAFAIYLGYTVRVAVLLSCRQHRLVSATKMRTVLVSAQRHAQRDLHERASMVVTQRIYGWVEHSQRGAYICLFSELPPTPAINRHASIKGTRSSPSALSSTSSCACGVICSTSAGRPGDRHTVPYLGYV